ncbi:hypothetical protein NC651_019161 [Populus alba x Populus x berolinensis]|nr:hypothetical protein NC651_019161 [Populus alba x Populus x berolinensis]
MPVANTVDGTDTVPAFALPKAEIAVAGRPQGFHRQREGAQQNVDGCEVKKSPPIFVEEFAGITKSVMIFGSLAVPNAKNVTKRTAFSKAEGRKSGRSFQQITATIPRSLAHDPAYGLINRGTGEDKLKKKLGKPREKETQNKKRRRRGRRPGHRRRQRVNDEREIKRKQNISKPGNKENKNQKSRGRSWLWPVSTPSPSSSSSSSSTKETEEATSGEPEERERKREQERRGLETEGEGNKIEGRKQRPEVLHRVSASLRPGSAAGVCNTIDPEGSPYSLTGHDMTVVEANGSYEPGPCPLPLVPPDPNHPQKQPPTVPTIGPLWNDISSKIGSKFCILGSSSFHNQRLLSARSRYFYYQPHQECYEADCASAAIGRRRSHVFRCDLLNENVNPGSEALNSMANTNDAEATGEENSRVGADDDEETEDVSDLNTNREV